MRLLLFAAVVCGVSGLAPTKAKAAAKSPKLDVILPTIGKQLVSAGLAGAMLFSGPADALAARSGGRAGGGGMRGGGARVPRRPLS